MHFYSGHYAISDSLNRRALAMYKQLYGDRHPLVAKILINLGASATRSRQLRRGRAARSSSVGHHARVLRQRPLRDRGGAHDARPSAGVEKKFDDAAAILRQALAIRERVYGPMHPISCVDRERAWKHRDQPRAVRRSRSGLSTHAGDLSLGVRRQTLLDRDRDFEPRRSFYMGRQDTIAPSNCTATRFVDYRRRRGRTI